MGPGLGRSWGRINLPRGWGADGDWVNLTCDARSALLPFLADASKVGWGWTGRRASWRGRPGVRLVGLRFCRVACLKPPSRGVGD